MSEHGCAWGLKPSECAACLEELNPDGAIVASLLASLRIGLDLLCTRAELEHGDSVVHVKDVRKLVRESREGERIALGRPS